jgi:hypothetical protein
MENTADRNSTAGGQSQDRRLRLFAIDGKERDRWYSVIRSFLDADWVDGDIGSILLQPDCVDVAVVNDERALPHVDLAIRDLVRRQIPTLHIVDGIQEWRNTWENPAFTIGEELAMPMFQPILCHKAACLGREQVRIFESWGNLGKCEVVGLPRLDAMISRRPRIRGAGEPFRLLVATARTPGFTPAQMDAARRALGDVKQWCAAHAQIDNVAIEPIWRLTHNLHAELNVTNNLKDCFGGDFADILQQVDALITTPSTAMLEGMLQGVPVALLDYTNSPPYNASAWMIAAPEHIDGALRGLISPPPARMVLQDTLLHDQLECRTPAAPRLNRLLRAMAKCGRRCRRAETPLTFPYRILSDDQDGHHLPEERFDLRTLYPHHPVFGRFDQVELQVELGHVRREIARQQKAIANQQEEIGRQCGEFNRQIAEQQSELECCRSRLQNIVNSRTWRMANKARRVVDSILLRRKRAKR